MITTLLALISGSALLNTLLVLVVWSLIFYVLFWGLAKAGVPEPFNKIITVIFVVAVVIVLANILFGLLGHPFIVR